MARLTQKADKPVGIVTRADTTQSTRNVDLVRQWAGRGSDALGEIPSLHKQAATALGEYARHFEKHGSLDPAFREDYHRSTQIVRDALAEHMTELVAAAGPMGGLAGADDYRDLQRAAETFNRTYAHRERAHEYQRVLERLDGAKWAQQTLPEGGMVPGPGSTTPRAPQSPQAPVSPIVPSSPVLPETPGPRVAPGTPDGPGNADIPWDPVEPESGSARRPRQPSRRIPRLPGAMWRGSRRIARAGSAAAIGGLANMLPRSLSRAERYETALGRLSARTGRLSAQALRSPDPWFSRTIRQADGRIDEVSSRREAVGVIELRGIMNDLREAFLMTGNEALGTMEQLGPHLTPTRALAAGQLGRRTGLGRQHAAGFYHRMLQRVAEPIPIRLHATREALPIGRDLMSESSQPVIGDRPSPFPNGPVTSSATLTMLSDVRRAMVLTGMQRRPAEFMADVEAVASELAGGQGLADYRHAIGIPALVADLGYGGQFSRSIATGTVRGVGATPNDTVRFAKIAALRKHLGPIRIGAGEYARTLDPKTLMGARALMESGDSRVLRAYMRYALERTGNDELAKEAVLRMMGGALSRRDVELLWGNRDKLARIEALGEGRGVRRPTERPSADEPRTERWLSGPMFNSMKTGTRDSLARQRAEMDVVEHRAGITTLGLATNIKDAVVTAASAFSDGHGPMDAIHAGIGRLSADSRAVLALHGLLRGGLSGKAQAALFLGAHGPARPRLHAPVQGGRVTGRFGDPRATHEHAGVDIALPAGTPVEATARGTVEFAGPRGAYGNLVIIRHDDGTTTSRYAHLRDIADLRAGQTVEAGDQLGTVGSTGRSTGPHLHFEVREAGQAVDPMPMLGGR